MPVMFQRQGPARCVIVLGRRNTYTVLWGRRLVAGTSTGGWIAGKGPPAHRFPEGRSPKVKRPACEVDHSAACNAKVKNVWSYTSISPFMMCTWQNHFFRLFQ